MRAFSVGLASTFVWAAACSSTGAVTPTVSAIQGPSLTASPLPVCTGSGTVPPGSFPGETVAFLKVVGSGFLPNVHLTSDDPKPLTPGVTLVSPGGARFPLFTDQVSPTELDAQVPDTDSNGQLAIPYGPFDLVVETPDDTSVTVPHAIDHLPPPHVSDVQPNSICQDQAATVVFSGTGFTPGTPQVTNSQGTGPITASATPTSVVLSIPAGIFPVASSPFPVSFQIIDLAGCTASGSLTVTPACGP